MGPAARKRFGQHFLIDEDVIARIHTLLKVSPDQSLLEIGPGHGCLTEGLLKASSNLVAIEIDSDLITLLRGRFPTLHLVQDDVLRVESGLFSHRRIIGNLPYNISTPLLLRLSKLADSLDLHFMLQQEVGNRLTAEPGSKAWGRLSVNMQLRYTIDRLLEVPPTAFNPPPTVMSTFLRFTKISQPPFVVDTGVFEALLRTCFSQRRKKISTSLAGFNVPWSELDFDCSLRGDQLSVAQYVSIANAVATT